MVILQVKVITCMIILLRSSKRKWDFLSIYIHILCVKSLNSKRKHYRFMESQKLWIILSILTSHEELPTVTAIPLNVLICQICSVTVAGYIFFKIANQFICFIQNKCIYCKNIFMFNLFMFLKSGYTCQYFRSFAIGTFIKLFILMKPARNVSTETSIPTQDLPCKMLWLLYYLI